MFSRLGNFHPTTLGQPDKIADKDCWRGFALCFFTFRVHHLFVDDVDLTPRTIHNRIHTAFIRLPFLSSRE